MPKIMLVPDHYARVMLAEIPPLNLRYLQHFNIVVLLLKATNSVYLKCVKHINTSIVY